MEDNSATQNTFDTREDLYRALGMLLGIIDGMASQRPVEGISAQTAWEDAMDLLDRAANREFGAAWVSFKTEVRAKMGVPKMNAKRSLVKCAELEAKIERLEGELRLALFLRKMRANTVLEQASCLEAGRERRRLETLGEWLFGEHGDCGCSLCEDFRAWCRAAHHAGEDGGAYAHDEDDRVWLAKHGRKDEVPK